MITFLINLTAEKVTNSIGRLFLYPYLREQKLRVIDGYGEEYENILSEIKYYIHNSSNIKNTKKEFQIFILLSVFNEKEKYFGGNLTNTINEIYEKFEDRLDEEKLEPSSISYLVLDHFDRDFTNTPFDINGAISEELNVKGYISSPVLGLEDVEKLNSKFIELAGKANYNDQDIFSGLELEIGEFFRKKEEDIITSEIGKIKDSAVRAHISKYKMIKKNLLNSLKYDVKKGEIKKSDFSEKFISILKGNEYFYDYLFREKDLDALERIWVQNNLIMQGEENFNLSKEFINKLSNLRDELRNEIENLIERKSDIIGKLEDRNSSNNCYINLNLLSYVQKNYIDQYLDNYLKEIITSKRMDSPVLITPVDYFKTLIQKYYSLKKVIASQRNNIYRIPFYRNNNLKYNENLLNFSYFLMFLIEYGEEKDYYMGTGKFLYLKNISYRPEYLRDLFNRYTDTLEKEAVDIELKQDSLKTTAVIPYYNEKSVVYNNAVVDTSVSERTLPDVGLFFDRDTIKDYKRNWLDAIDEKIDTYIEFAEGELSDYQNKKNEFLLLPRTNVVIEREIKAEVADLTKALNAKRVELSELESQVKTNIKNEWKKLNEKEVSLDEMEIELSRRVVAGDFMLLLVLVIVSCFISTVDPLIKIPMYNLTFIQVLIYSIIGASVIGFLSLLIFMCQFTGQRNYIKSMMMTSKRIRDSYIRKLQDIFETKKKYIDKQIECRVAEKNLNLAKKEEKRIREEIELLGCYIEIIKNHCQMVETVSNTINNIKHQKEDEIEYNNENFRGELKELDSKRAPFENDIFNMTKYIEIQEYKKFVVNYNEQENDMNPNNIFGCEAINIVEDNIYKKVEE